jgi:hypothetical protein
MTSRGAFAFRTSRPFLLLTFVILLGVAPAQSSTAQNLPERISDKAFWQLIEDFSEPGGSFRLENFMSNEQSYQFVVPELKKAAPRSGVYLGVGPEQNFTYILATKPQISFIVDIRRQNLIEHLLYKSLFERSSDRADFLSKLFSRKRPKGLGVNTPIATILEEFADTRADAKLFADNLADAIKHLETTHEFPLSPYDRDTLQKVYNAFFECGLKMDFRCNNPGGGNGANLTYQQLMAEEDGQGNKQGFLATEDAFRYIQDVQKKNLIVPLVGDFAGPKAIRAVAAYIKERNATLAAFYISNVEDYLFTDPTSWRSFYDNAATLPTTPDSLFIRVISGTRYRTANGPLNQPGSWVTVLTPIQPFIQAFLDGKINSQLEMIQHSRWPQK